MDFLGTKLATCSCDKSIRLFDVNLTTGSQNFVTDLKGHEGPVCTKIDLSRLFIPGEILMLSWV